MRHIVSIIISIIGFTNARSWLADVREHADPHLTCILVGNKVDLVSESDIATGRHREVTTEEAELWAKEEGLLFVEASAKSGQNVELAFEQASRDILDKIRRGVFEDDRVRVSRSSWWSSFNLYVSSHPVSNYPSRHITPWHLIKVHRNKVVAHRDLTSSRPRILVCTVLYSLSSKVIAWNL